MPTSKRGRASEPYDSNRLSTARFWETNNCCVAPSKTSSAMRCSTPLKVLRLKSNSTVLIPQVRSLCATTAQEFRKKRSKKSFVRFTGWMKLAIVKRVEWVWDSRLPNAPCVCTAEKFKPPMSALAAYSSQSRYPGKQRTVNSRQPNNRQNITVKALANLSPGFVLKPWDHKGLLKG